MQRSAMDNSSIWCLLEQSGDLHPGDVLVFTLPKKKEAEAPETKSAMRIQSFVTPKKSHESSSREVHAGFYVGHGQILDLDTASDPRSPYAQRLGYISSFSTMVEIRKLQDRTPDTPVVIFHTGALFFNNSVERLLAAKDAYQRYLDQSNEKSPAISLTRGLKLFVNGGRKQSQQSITQPDITSDHICSTYVASLIQMASLFKDGDTRVFNRFFSHIPPSRITTRILTSALRKHGVRSILLPSCQLSTVEPAHFIHDMQRLSELIHSTQMSNNASLHEQFKYLYGTLAKHLSTPLFLEMQPIADVSVSQSSELTARPFKKPLYIGCSGGGGHNSAIEAIIQCDRESHQVASVKYTPQLAEYRAPSKQQRMIAVGAAAGRSTIIQKVLDALDYPVLPVSKDLEAEKVSLQKKQMSADGHVKMRDYVDMLLDVYPAGYESAAIWNVLQRRDAVQTLNRLIALQTMSDDDNYSIVKHHFLQMLQKAASDGSPYTEVVSTQAMALPALCDAVIEYNRTVIHPILLKQYMTDLPTVGAIHFFNALRNLSAEQCAVMELYAVGNKRDQFSAILGEQGIRFPFASIELIDPIKNPMVRAGFKAPDLAARLQETPYRCAIQVNHGTATQLFEIEDTQRVAAVMLGSQASQDTVSYVMALVEANHYDFIFVFGGMTASIRETIEAAYPSHPTVILLENQNDTHMAPIMMRADLIVQRGGGLSVMEQMAIPHRDGQLVLIHGKLDEETRSITSGITWEDENVLQLLQFFQANGVIANQITPELFPVYLKRWISEPEALPCDPISLMPQKETATPLQGAEHARNEIPYPTPRF